MKKFCLIILFVVLVGVLWPATAYADGSCGPNLTWSLNAGTGELTISGSGAMTSYSSYSSVPWYSSRSSIRSVSIGEDVTSISDYAFYDCSNISSITVPDGLLSIGTHTLYSSSGNYQSSDAFYNCPAIRHNHLDFYTYEFAVI